MAPKKILRTYEIGSKVDGSISHLHLVTGVCSEVELVSMPAVPTHVMATIANGYKGVYESKVMPEEIPGLTEDILNTKLATPLEMIHIVWLIKGVTRAWTHQAVRYRIGSAYVQQSMRFLGYQKIYEVFVPGKIAREEFLFEEFAAAAMKGVRQYVFMKDLGAEDQDARGVLPTNIMTKLFWGMSLSTLRHIFETRWCCQAQTDEWIPILAQMRKTLRSYDKLEAFLSAPIDRGQPCGFNASFDRPCVWKQRTAEEMEQSVLNDVE